jgi:hypothetical protein
MSINRNIRSIGLPAAMPENFSRSRSRFLASEA